MEIILNGQARRFDEPLTVAALIQACNLTPLRVAVEVNEQLVRRTEFDGRTLQAGDRVEIVTLVGGG